MSGILEAAKEVGRKVVVGAALTAAASPFFSLPATAQQVAADAGSRPAATASVDTSRCSALEGPSRTRCIVGSLEAHGAAARKDGAAADARGAAADVRGAAEQSKLDCLNRVGTLLDQGKISEAKQLKPQCG